jgi:hypothetical protein
MKLFSFWRSLATYRVRIALNLKGLSPEVIEVDLMKGHQRDPKFRDVNPMMALPALVDGDGPALSRLPSLNISTRRIPSRRCCRATRKRVRGCAGSRRSSPLTRIR